MASSAITPPASPSRNMRKEYSLPFCLPDCRRIKSNAYQGIRWFTKDFVENIVAPKNDMQHLYHLNAPTLANHCGSLEYLKCRLAQLLNVTSKNSDSVQMEELKIEFTQTLVNFSVQCTNELNRMHLDEVGTAINFICRYAGTIRERCGISSYDNKDSSYMALHFQLELRYYLMAVLLWASTKSYSKDWKLNLLKDINLQQKQLSVADEYALYVLTDIFQLMDEQTEKLCICFFEFRALFVYFVAISSTATDVFIEWLQRSSGPCQLAYACKSFSDSVLPAFKSYDGFTSNAEFQPFVTKCVQVLVNSCFSPSTNPTSDCLQSALSALAHFYDLLGAIDDGSLRLVWDFFASKLNGFHLPTSLRDLLLGSDNSSNGDVVDYFRSVTLGHKKYSEISANEMAFPIVTFVEIFLENFFGKLKTENDRRRVWRKLKGGLYKRFYEASLRKLNDDGWLNAIFLLTASAVTASEHSSEDFYLVGEILQRISFTDLSETAQLAVTTSLFSLLKLNSCWSTEFHPAQCIRSYFCEAVNKSALSNAVFIHYFHCIDVYFSNLSSPSALDAQSADLVNISGLTKIMSKSYAGKTSADVDFIHKLMEVVSAILLSVRQLVLAAGDSQNSSDDHMPQKSLDSSSPLCRLVVHVSSSLYPLASTCEQCVQKISDVSMERFVSLLRGFLLLSLDVSHLPVISNISTMVRPQDIIASFTSCSNPKLGVMFLSDCLHNARILSLLQDLEVVSPPQSLAHFFRLSVRLLVLTETATSKSAAIGVVPDLSCYRRFQECVYRLGSLQLQDIGRQDSVISAGFLLGSIVNLVRHLGLSNYAETAVVLESFFPVTEEACKSGWDNTSVALFKTLFRIAGSILSSCTPLLHKPFRPDCFLSKMIMLYMHRIVNARKNLPQQHVFLGLHKWILPGLLTGLSRLMQQLPQGGDDPNIRRYVNDCVLESMTRGNGRPNYSPQNLDVHPLVLSGLIGGKSASGQPASTNTTHLDSVIVPILEDDDPSNIRKIALGKLVSDCFNSSFPNWSLTTSLIEHHLATVNWQFSSRFSMNLEATLVLVLPGLLDHCCWYEERRQDVPGYLDAMDRLFRLIFGLLTSHELWASSSLLGAIGDFVDRTATAHPKLTFSALTRFLLPPSSSRNGLQNDNNGMSTSFAAAARPLLMAIRTAVVRMELDYGNSAFIRPHFEAFESQFLRLSD